MLGYAPLGDLLFAMLGVIIVGRVAAFAVDTYREMTGR